MLVNPTIVDRSTSLIEDLEGCLSVPGFAWPTARAAAVTVAGRDAYGEPVSLTCTGYAARCMQHEVDHLDGQLYLSRLGGRTGKTARREAKASAWYGASHRFVPVE
jgi:peptide deformylase